MSTLENSAAREGLLLAREALATRAQALRDKQWQVFAWSSNLLIGTTGGVIALAGVPQFEFTSGNRILLSLAVAILTFFSYIWIRHNFSHKEKIVEHLKRCDEQLGIPTVPSHGSAWIGYHAPVIMLAIAAIATIWLAGFTTRAQGPAATSAASMEEVR